MAEAIVFTVSVLANPGTPSSRRWPLASSPSRRRSTRYFCPTTTCATCCRSAGIHWPSSRTSCVISCVDFIRSGQTFLAARTFDQTKTNAGVLITGFDDRWNYETACVALECEDAALKRSATRDMHALGEYEPRDNDDMSRSSKRDHSRTE